MPFRVPDLINAVEGLAFAFCVLMPMASYSIPIPEKFCSTARHISRASLLSDGGLIETNMY